MEYLRDGLRFDVSQQGPADGQAVILLHGFPADNECWTTIATELAQAGYRTLAPNQRGYSPQARPAGRRNYVMNELVNDVLALADAAGVDTFHLVGHDWGASVAWHLAADHPDRVTTLTALSVPHPQALKQASIRGLQLLYSWYMTLFRTPFLPERLLGVNRGRLLRFMLTRNGLNAAAAHRYAQRAAHTEHITGPLNWYRALPLHTQRRLPPVTVPTLYVWSDQDGFITRTAANLCHRSVEAPYHFETLAGVSHWLPEQEPEQVAEMILKHLSGLGVTAR